MSRIGLIQSRGIGDIIIALPIAKYLRDRGHEVFWPIDRRFLPSFAHAVDYVEFLPFDFTPTTDGFLMTPMRLLKAKGCDRIIPLYSYLANTSIANQDYFRSLKFDEYKYAIAGVPFAEKWNLALKRDAAREQTFFDSVVERPEYVVTQFSGSNCEKRIALPPEYAGHQVIEITEKSENIFDWLLVLERARHLFLIDSCFANLVEQLGFTNPKTFIFRSEVRFTPVLRGQWAFSAQTATASKPVAPAMARV